MADIGTCYFCGTMDEPLEDHRVIPAEYDPPSDLQMTVAVCASCGRKLDRVIDPVVTFVDRAGKPAAAARDDRGPVASATSPADPEAGSEEPPDQPTASATEAAVDTGEDYPPEARQVLLMLENRSLPVERADIEELASTAYELERGTVGEALDALIEGGVLVEEAGRIDVT